MRFLSAQLWAIILLFGTFASAITVSSRSKTPHGTPPRRGHSTSDNDSVETSLVSTELMKRSENVSEITSSPSKDGGDKLKEESPSDIDVLRTAEVAEDDFPKADKNPRIYYGDTRSSIDFDSELPEPKYNIIEKPKEKYYFPKHYYSSTKSQPKSDYDPLIGLPGKRGPDPAEYEAQQHHRHHHHHHHEPYPVGESHPVVGHHEQEDHAHHKHEETPYHGHHGGESHPEKEHHHVSSYGHHHYGGYRHTIGDKVDAVGKALQVLIPSALFLTGVSALFPNRVHVPTNTPVYPNLPHHRQRRSAKLYRRRSPYRPHRRGPPPPPPRAHISPEFEDIPNHILRAEHRIMDGTPVEVYPEQGAAFVSAENAPGFNPFGVFKGPGNSKEAVKNMQHSIKMPHFPDIPEMKTIHEKNNQFLNQFPDVPDASVETSAPFYGPGSRIPPAEPSEETLPDRPPTTTRSRRPPATSTEFEGSSAEYRGPPPPPPPSEFNGPPPEFERPPFDKPRGNKNRGPPRRRKVVRKPAMGFKETVTRQELSESQTPSDDPNAGNPNVKPDTNVKAEKQFMNSLRNLVTPDVAQAILANKEPPKSVDLSPDGPVMGLLNSYAQHERDSPACQKRALCELAVRGKTPMSTKFEAFLWSVATLVPDVFSEMYDLQEVFQSIRDQRCNRFDCAAPNLDLQV